MPTNWIALIKAILMVVDEVLDAYLQDVTPTPPTPPIFTPPTPPTPPISGQFSGQPVMQQGTTDSYQSGQGTLGPMMSRS